MYLYSMFRKEQFFLTTFCLYDWAELMGSKHNKGYDEVYGV